MNATDLANFLGWCTVMNFAALFLASIALVVARKPITNLHARMFDIEPTRLSGFYFNFLANYKILVLVFNLVPYLALRIMGT